MKAIGFDIDISSIQIAVVVPIYNAAEVVERCLKAILAHTPLRAKLILVDDASTQSRISEILDSVAGLPFVQIIRHTSNKGYTHSINAGIAAAPGYDVVLLNSDTEVGPGWLRQLAWTAYCNQDVATVTAISNNAGAFSYPLIDVNNVIPASLTSSEYAIAVRQSHGAMYPELPTGNGFCLYIKRAVIDDIGIFDADAFPRGYGEENDFCMRAFRRGWRHVQDDRTWVFHVRSASLGSEVEGLSRSGAQVLAERYPDYNALVQVGLLSERRLKAAARIAEISRCYEHSTSGKAVTPVPAVMHVMPPETSVHNANALQMMDQLQPGTHQLLVRCTDKELTLADLANGQTRVLESFHLVDPVSPIAHRNAEYDRVLGQWMASYAIDLVVLHHLAGHSLGLASVVRKMGVPMHYRILDDYAVCPTVDLRDETGQPCGGDCTPATENDCGVQRWAGLAAPPLKHRYVHLWRAEFARIMAQCSGCSAESATLAEMAVRHALVKDGKSVCVLTASDAEWFGVIRSQMYPMATA